MMVTAVTPVDKRKSKVFLEEGFAFVLYRGELRRFHIEEGMELEQETYCTILEDVLIPRAKERALYLLGSAIKTEAWVRGKLLDGGYPREAADRVLAFLKEYRLVDDGVYVDSYVRTYSGKKSRRQMIYELRQKGVDKELVEQAFMENPVDEEESARQLLSRRIKGKDGITPDEWRRHSAWLGRKGYSYDVIHKVMRELRTQEQQDWSE